MSEKRQSKLSVSYYRIISTTTVYGQKNTNVGWQKELLRGATSPDSKHACMASQLGKQSLVTNQSLKGMCQ